MPPPYCRRTRPRRLARTVRAAAAAALALGLVGALASCASDPAPIADRAAPEQAVKSALQALVAKGSVDFTADFTLGGASFSDDGSFTLHPNAEQFTHSSDNGQGRVSTVEVIDVDNRAYVRAPAVTGPGGCWAAAAPTTLDVLTGGVYDQHLIYLPFAAVVASTARGTGYVDDSSEDVGGTLDLVQTLRLANAALPAQLGVSSGRVQAQFHIQDGVFVGFSVALHDFASANSIDRAKLATLGQARLDVTFDFPGQPVVITAPPAAQVSTYRNGALTPCTSGSATPLPSASPPAGAATTGPTTGQS